MCKERRLLRLYYLGKRKAEEKVEVEGEEIEEWEIQLQFKKAGIKKQIASRAEFSQFWIKIHYLEWHFVTHDTVFVWLEKNC